ncbi:MAG: phosphoribosyl-AMP cyclohydrolase [Candidatus Omnitrophota bacterium]
MKLELKFNQDGLVPAIVQDYKTGEVLMLAYMNQAAFEETVRVKKGVFFSRSRQKMWLKGESSGHVQEVKEIFIDCDKDAVLLKVEQTGGACHTGFYSCFYRQYDPETGELKETGKKIFEPGDIYKK